MFETIYDREDIVAEGAMTVKEAVEWSGIGRTRLYLEMAEGRLPFVQRGKRRLIPRKALRLLLAESLVTTNGRLPDFEKDRGR